MVIAGVLKFVLFEAAVWLAALRLARLAGWREGAEKWLAVLAIEVALESSAAALFSFAGWNSRAAYWAVAAVCLLAGFRERLPLRAIRYPRTWAAVTALAAPLLCLGFRPVEEIDSINYLHYLIDWMGNRATPYAFATNYVAFWELSFLPVWTVTGVDLFFPLLALKAVAMMALALWLAGREIALDGPLLIWAIAGVLAMRHYWFEYSGVPTLKNDVLHGVGFVLLALIVLRASYRRLAFTDTALLALATAFVTVKYTGIFLVAIAAIVLLWKGVRNWGLVAAVFLLTSGHYYLRSVIQHGSPFYPFQINLGPIHLPGTADLSYSSILYNLHDPRLWRAFFLPPSGVSPAGLLFPVILPATLGVGVWRCIAAARRRKLVPLDWLAAAVLCGWLLYFRSVFSASGGPGDLQFILNNLNSIRYVDGVLAVSELLLVACLGSRAAAPLIALNLAGRLPMLYMKLSPQYYVIAILVLFGVLLFRRSRWLVVPTLAALTIACPVIVQWHRGNWTTYWNDLKPALVQARTSGLAVLALEDGGYFAGHIVAAGNPVHPGVRAVLPEEVDPGKLPAALAVLVTPGSEVSTRWAGKYKPQILSWGYQARAESKYGGVFVLPPGDAVH
jgi:hypothetical protein